ncbi:hypothetical protein P152DRAFT_394632 [Eremomyces bilateralis CBS 781.70]|uniref:MaoC-like domain-containing protein n=1 Tax=Eremomyces bilateralis CBS 781.70 TaxID=1392243 RepID=A0A6G1G6P3_9PEZI|nr:uncharacterized protein P152DRAFT_394632 [Eremomyces bilateralis CBS 781.70]KAF1813755.1 hypothetical protein P152DRAFT_394632 [Eremomyces bilateralis CBS 781.70]
MAPATIDLQLLQSRQWSVDTSYNASIIISYNLALGAAGTNLPLTFEAHPSFHALPSFACVPTISVMGAVSQAFPSLLPKFQPHNQLHGEHYIRSLAPFPIPSSNSPTVPIRTTGKIIGCVSRPRGVTVTVAIETSHPPSGTVICYSEWTSFVLGIPPAGASTTTEDRGPATATYPTPSRTADKVLQYKTTPEQGALYRAASGDLNPLHIDPATAKRAGFQGPILTGTCTLGVGIRQIIEEFAGGDVGRFDWVRCRLSKPVFPGELVRTEMWEEEGRRIAFRMVVGDGKGEKVVIGNAAVGLKTNAGNL